VTTLRYVVVDVFTDRPLAGNPLAVFTDARGIDADTMQALAREIGFSETAFVLPAEEGDTARVRIFTPAAELPFAGPVFTLVVLDSRAAVSALRPDVNALAELEVNASCVAGSGAAWKTRMFAPGLGVPEDPATGAAAGPLVCHLWRHGLVPWGTEIEIAQGDEIGRPSTLYARAEGRDDTIERVEVGGSAVVVARGEFRL
jgi:predicted PhzF superfamily epimerase YddE/YHI9